MSLIMRARLLGCFSAGAGRHARSCRSTRVPGVLRPEVWERWLDWDPVRMVDRYADALRSLRAVWIDAGTRDEWFLDLGAEAFRDGLARIGVPDERIHFELFDGTPHGHRLPLPAGAWPGSRTAWPAEGAGSPISLPRPRVAPRSTASLRRSGESTPSAMTSAPRSAAAPPGVVPRGTGHGRDGQVHLHDVRGTASSSPRSPRASR